ncbi:SCO0930 family lipoprotein [Streptomyces avidinii]
MGIKRGTTLATAAIVVVLAATACGPTDDKAADTTKPVGAAAAQDYGQAPAAADGAAGAAGAAGAKPAGQLTAAPNDQLGQVLTDSAGLTLYRFDKDTAKPPKSNCDGDCAKTWPVVAAGDATAAAGMDPALLGEVVRTDGSKQLTVAGWPAYRYNKDAKAGDVNGQGVGGVWFAFGPDGKKAAKAEAAAPAPAEGGAAEADGKLSVAKDPKLGDHIVDGKGMTVYRFKPDTQWPMTSKCVGDCLTKWPVGAVRRPPPAWCPSPATVRRWAAPFVAPGGAYGDPPEPSAAPLVRSALRGRGSCVSWIFRRGGARCPRSRRWSTP